MYADLAGEKHLSKALLDYSVVLYAKSPSQLFGAQITSPLASSTGKTIDEVVGLYSLKRTDTLEAFLAEKPWVGDCLAMISALLDQQRF